MGKRIWNTKGLWTGDLLVLLKSPTLEKHFSFLFTSWSYRKLQSLLKSQMAAAFSRAAPCLYLVFISCNVLMVYHSLNYRMCLFSSFLSSSEMDFKHQSIRKRQIRGWKKWGSVVGSGVKKPPLFKCISHCKCRKVCFWKYMYWLAQKWNFGKTFV